MFDRGAAIGLMAALLSVATTAQADEKEKEPFAIVELGAAGGWSLSGGSSFGPSAAVEFEPIKNWLEIEVGTAPLFGNGHTELDTDVLFKKPFTLSDKLEFMIGGGPQYRRRVRVGFYVLANAGSKVRMVSGTQLQLLFQPGA